MASILDLFGVSSGDKQKDEAINQGLLHAGLTLMQSRGKLAPAIGQAGLSGLQAFQQHGQQDYVRKMQQAQLAEIERKRVQADAEDKFRANLPSPLGQANQAAAQAGPLGTVAAAKAQPPVDPYQQLLHGAAQSGAIPIGSYLSTMAPKAPEYKTVGDSLVQVGPGGVKEAYRAPDKPEKTPEALRSLEIIYGKGSPQYQAAAERLGTKMTTHAPATSVSVNTGQKGFDNTLKLRSDFRSEPIYKAHNEVVSAHSQITQSLKQGTAAGDLAGATKIMKILDPGSVVRESELGMAMAATGLFDRVGNYANMVITGQKLTPSQRKDFQALADVLAKESEKLYAAKRGEYEGIAKRNELNVPDVVGPASPPKQRAVKRTGTHQGRKVVEYEDGSIEYAD
jgi:hypothetical protein